MRRQKTGAFTLVELIVTITLVSLLAFGSAVILAGVFSIFAQKRDTTSLRSEGQAALQRFTFDFRKAQTVTYTSATDITLAVDFDDDGVADTVRYYLSGTEFRREVSSASVLSAHVTGLSFTWTSPRIILSLDLERGEETVYLRTGAYARRL